MRYILFVLIVMSALGCQKQEEPCPAVYYDDFMIPNIKVLVFIDKDSVNLLETRRIDTTDIIMKNDRGVAQKFKSFPDSTFSKIRYVNLPLSDQPGNNTLVVSVKGKVNTIRYTYTIDQQRCRTNYIYDNFKLNGSSYQLHPRPDYEMYGTAPQPFKMAIGISPIYIVLEP